MHLWGSHTAAPSLRATDTRTTSPGIRSPMLEIGGACSQAPDSRRFAARHLVLNLAITSMKKVLKQSATADGSLTIVPSTRNAIFVSHF